MSGPTFIYVIHIATTPEKLWQALTSGDFSSQYWGGRRLESSWQKGAPLQSVREDGGLDFIEEILEADPPRRLSYTFDVQPHAGKSRPGGEPAFELEREPPSHVTFDLAEAPPNGRTGPVMMLTLTHDQFPPDSKIYQGVSPGWPAILSSLKSVLETGVALYPNWR